MKPMRPCLECGARTARTRCPRCESQWQKARNALPRRQQYRSNAYTRQSKAARENQPWCALCGTRQDLTWDHEHGQVECRSCNASHRRNAS